MNLFNKFTDSRFKNNKYKNITNQNIACALVVFIFIPNEKIIKELARTIPVHMILINKIISIN